MSYTRAPRYHFHVQKGHAKDRGIEWRLTFEEWWGIWTDSGHWGQRGRGPGCYCMARHGDVGPYAVGNVAIITFAQNCSDARRGFRGLPMGVFPHSKNTFAAKRSINGRQVYLGSFKTPEEAHEAYLRAA